MNAYERFTCRLAGEPVDRPPNFDIFMTFAARRTGRPLKEYYTDYRVLVDANTKSLTSNRAVFYVAISRPRNDITLFTDDASKLAAAMSREPKKFAALELRDPRNEALILKTKVDRAARGKLAAQLRMRSPIARPKMGALRVQR